MADARPVYEPVQAPDVTDLIIDDGEPVDGIISERQMRLLVASLYDSWRPGRPFMALANVGVFFHPGEPPLVPDVLLSLDVAVALDLSKKEDNSYFLWRFGKPPDVVVEVVSNRKGRELEKREDYARLGVGWYAIHDPHAHLGERPLRVFELHGRSFVEVLDPSWLPGLGLGLVLWEGDYEGVPGTWLRWCDEEGRLLLLGSEQVEAARERADAERERADTERERADAERERADLLEARLRELEGR